MQFIQHHMNVGGCDGYSTAYNDEINMDQFQVSSWKSLFMMHSNLLRGLWFGRACARRSTPLWRAQMVLPPRHPPQPDAPSSTSTRSTFWVQEPPCLQQASKVCNRWRFHPFYLMPERTWLIRPKEKFTPTKSSSLNLNFKQKLIWYWFVCLMLMHSNLLRGLWFGRACVRSTPLWRVQMVLPPRHPPQPEAPSSTSTRSTFWVQEPPCLHQSSLNLSFKQSLIWYWFVYVISRRAGGLPMNTPLARSTLFNLNKKYLLSAGATLSPTSLKSLQQVEISPLISYAGENLADQTKGKVYTEQIVLIEPQF